MDEGKRKVLQQIAMGSEDATQTLNMPETLSHRTMDEDALERATKMLDEADPDDIARLSDDSDEVNKILKTRYGTKKPPAPTRLPVEPPEITDKMRVQADMAEARRDFKRMPSLGADDLDDVKFDIEKLEKLRKVDSASRSPRAEVLKRLSRGVGKAMRPVGKALGAASQGAAALAGPLSLLTMEEANAGSDQVPEDAGREYNPSPQAMQQMYNEDAEQAARIDALRKLLGGDQ